MPKASQLRSFNEEERKFIKELSANGQLLVSDDPEAELPPGVTHILLVQRGKKTRLIRRRMA